MTNIKPQKTLIDMYRLIYATSDQHGVVQCGLSQVPIKVRKNDLEVGANFEAAQKKLSSILQDDINEHFDDYLCDVNPDFCLEYLDCTRVSIPEGENLPNIILG